MSMGGGRLILLIEKIIFIIIGIIIQITIGIITMVIIKIAMMVIINKNHHIKVKEVEITTNLKNTIKGQEVGVVLLPHKKITQIEEIPIHNQEIQDKKDKQSR